MDSAAVIEGAPGSPVILHVPHASTTIPAAVRAGILLDDHGLAVELNAMTDAHTDVIALRAAQRAQPRPWMFVNQLSRLVVDPERFPDDREEMATVGMGAVYTRTSHRRRLRAPTRDEVEQLITTYFRPYANALTTLVAERLQACGRAVIIDVHSYPRDALPYELHGDQARPEVCLGVDPTHTPDRLFAGVRTAFASVGEVAVNEPFSGTYVPLDWYLTDQRVESIMIEIRRDVYLDEDREFRANPMAALVNAVATAAEIAAEPGSTEGPRSSRRSVDPGS